MPETQSATALRHATGAKRILEVEGLNGWYGESHVLHDITFDVNRGEVVTLLGRNGAGKTTTLRALMGLLKKRTGRIVFDGQDTIARQSRQIALMGLGYVPEERGIFSSLTVRENLRLPPVIAEGGLPEAEIFELFPNLQERLGSFGGSLSGGEQQMLAIARILRTGAHVLLLDEPTEGLAPVIVNQIGVTIEKLKARGFTIVLVEQNFHFARRLADRHVIVQEGRTVESYTAADLDANIAQVEKYLGI